MNFVSQQKKIKDHFMRRAKNIINPTTSAKKIDTNITIMSV